MQDSSKISSRPRLHSLFSVGAIIILAFLVRLYVCLNTLIINPDGTLYVHQARAIYYGLWDQLTSCAMGYVSPYPFFIAGLYPIFHEWVFAARSVSLLFGTLTLIPLYLLLRRFLDFRISAGCALIFAVTQTHVSASADVIRDPASWFFCTLALYLFVRYLEGHKEAHVVCSSISFFVAASFRIEAALFLCISGLWILIIGKKRIRHFAFYAAPMLAFLFLGLAAERLLDVSSPNLFRLSEIMTKYSGASAGYHLVREDLRLLIQQPMLNTFVLFLERARQLVWFIALGTLLTYLIKAFFYPFFLPFLLGFKGIREKLRQDRLLLYLLSLSFLSLCLLYFHLLHTWVIAPRFLLMVIIPSFMIVGYGLARILEFLRRSFRLNSKLAFALACSLILAFGLPKSLKTREADKTGFEAIARCIAEREGNRQVIHVASSLHILRWISFYANLDYPGAPCPQPYDDFSALIGRDYTEFVNNLRERGMKYFVWEEKHWPGDRFDFEKTKRPEDFLAVRSWEHPDSGKLILYEVL